MKKLINNIKENRAFWFIFVLLFLAPFFWFSKDLYILGEDDTGLTYYNTLGTLNQSLSSWFSADHIGRFEEGSGHFLIFNLLLLSLKAITFNLVNVQQLVYGLLLSLSFFYIVKILELLSSKKSITYLVAGLFYSLSPFFVMVEYYYHMPSTFAILLGPALAYHLLISLHSKNWRPLLIGAIWSLVLSRVLMTPTFINFMVLLFIFIIVYAIFTKKFTIVQGLKYFFLYGIFILLINSSMTFSYIYSFMESDSSAFNQALSNRNRPVYLDDMVGYIKKEIELNRINYYLTNIFPEPISRLQGFRNYDFYTHYLNKTWLFMYFVVFSSFTGLILAVKKRSRIIAPVLILFILSLLLMTVNIFQLTEKFYYFLMYNTPVFNMNRIPSMKFHIPYLFYYTILTGISLDFLHTSLKGRYKKILISMLFMAILANSFYFISGRVFTQKIPFHNTVRAMNFNEDYIQVSKDFKKYIKDDSQFLLFPLGYGFGSFIMGEDNSQFYRSMVSGFRSFTGHNMFGNLRVLGSVLDPSINTAAHSFYFQHKTEDLLTLAMKLNIKYVLYTKNTAPLKQFGELIREHTYESPDYHKPLDMSKPVYENDGYSIYKLKNYDKISHLNTGKSDSELRFKKVSDFMYKVKINTQSSDKLIFHEGFSSNWKIYSISKEQFDCRNATNFAREYPNVLECLHDNDNLTGNMELLSLGGLSPHPTKHTLHNSFGNSWEINTKAKDEYLIILFDGQKYYLAGIFTSTIFLILFIFIYLWHGKKRTKSV